MRLFIEKLISGGDGLAIGEDGKKVFVARTLPGEGQKIRVAAPQWAAPATSVLG